MWLPGPLYEALPCAYIVGGALFVAGTVYARPDQPMLSVYLACGVISILSGILVFARRRAARTRNVRED